MDTPLEISYDSMDAVPADFASLYTENDGKAVLTHVNGLKSSADIAKLQEANRKEREDHKKTRDLIKPWNDLGMTPEEASDALARIPELEASQGKIDETKMEELVGARLAQKTAPLERTLAEREKLVETLQTENSSLKASIERRDLHEQIRTIGTEMKILGTAMPDAEMLAGAYFERDPDTKQFVTKADVVGVEPGMDIKQFMKAMQQSRPHWWPNSNGGGAGGGGAAVLDGKPNPWAAGSWNMTEQGRVVTEHGMEVAERLAKSAGTTVGGLPPAAKK